MSLAYLSLGSNLGNKNSHLNEAILLLNEKAGKIKRVSSFLISEPWGYKSKNNYLNAVVSIETTLSPLELLTSTQQIEIVMGRQQKTINTYADRIIDIDILLFDNKIINLQNLKIPHPLILERDFILLPLTEIAPDLIHPSTLKLFSDFIK